MRIPKGGTPLFSPTPRVRKHERKRKGGRDVNHLKSLILHRRFKKYDKRSLIGFQSEILLQECLYKSDEPDPPSGG